MKHYLNISTTGCFGKSIAGRKQTLPGNYAEVHSRETSGLIFENNVYGWSV